MKKIPFIILLTFEIIAGLISAGLLLSDYGVCSYVLGSIVLALMLYPFLRRLKRASSEEEKAKIRRTALWVMLIPAAVALVVVAYVVIALIAYFGV